MKYDVESIYNALRMRARRLADYDTRRQGSGLIQVEEAWRLLQEYAQHPRVSVSFAAPIRSPFAKYLRTPHEGVGLYEVGGWRPGQEETRRVKVTRHGGSLGPLQCKITLMGNDGTFHAPESVALPPDSPVEIPIGVHIASLGIHDAIFRLSDVQSSLPLGQTALTIIAATTLNTANGFRYEARDSLKPGSERSYFIEIPVGIPLLKIKIMARKGRLTFTSDLPSVFRGVYPPTPLAGVLSGKVDADTGPYVRLVEQPVPGVWEFLISGNAEFSLVAEGLRAPSASSTISHTAYLRKLRVSASSPSPKLEEIKVPLGTKSLLVNVESHNAGTADLYLYECDSVKSRLYCHLWDMKASAQGKAHILVRWPAPGQWKLLVDPLNGAARQFSISEVIAGRDSVVPPGWTPVRLVETIDPAAEREEEVSLRSDIGRYARTDFRPIPLSIDIEPIDVRAAPYTRSTPDPREVNH